MNRRSFILMTFLGIVSCSKLRSPTNKSLHRINSQWPQKLRLTVTDVFGFQQLENDYEQFRAVLEQILGIEVELIPVNNLVAAAPALLANRLDLVLAGPSEYLILKARAGAVPVISITRPGYFTVVSVRADSGITALKQLRGKRVGMRAEGAGASHLGTLQLLIEAGLDPKTDFEIIMVGDQGVKMLMTGEIDAWGDAIARWKRFSIKENMSERDLPIIARGQPLPNDIFVANSHLSSDFINHLQSLMLEHCESLITAILKAPANAKYEESELVIGNDSDYNQVRKLYKLIGQENLIL